MTAINIILDDQNEVVTALGRLVDDLSEICSKDRLQRCFVCMGLLSYARKNRDGSVIKRQKQQGRHHSWRGTDSNWNSRMIIIDSLASNVW